MNRIARSASTVSGDRDEPYFANLELLIGVTANRYGDNVNPTSSVNKTFYELGINWIVEQVRRNMYLRGTFQFSQ